jgi:cystathionine gamma-lyase
VVHSATKYLNGHSDVVAGLAVVGDNPALAEQRWPLAELPAA